MQGFALIHVHLFLCHLWDDEALAQHGGALAIDLGWVALLDVRFKALDRSGGSQSVGIPFGMVLVVGLHFQLLVEIGLTQVAG